MEPVRDPAQALRAALGNPPFPWQSRLLAEMIDGRLPRALDLPTGLGKTSVMAIWLVARAAGAARLPRRLIYVVDRRAVVDQATREAERLRGWVDRDPAVRRALGLERPLPISTLRGQFVDNREWLEDPSSPAIVVGTVDMVGSRLLFEGYACSRKMRPYHAGLLGCDSLFVLDEAHLVPPFERLVEAVATDPALWPPADPDKALVSRLRILSLSATGRDHTSASFALTDDDREHPVVRQRLEAPKCLSVEPLGDQKLAEVLAARAWALTHQGTVPVRCLIFADRRDDAVQAKDALLQLAKKDPPPVELLVGARRVFERGQVESWLESHGFLAGSLVPRTRATFLFATSAGEVGIDLDADHVVCDLVVWERMVQRLGRVNRRGFGSARVVVIDPPPSKEAAKAREKEAEELGPKDRDLLAREARLDAVRQLLNLLPPREDGGVEASPTALVALKSTSTDLVRAATTPEPLRPALSRPLVDAWSMTSLRHHPGRPEVGPWLRGWVDDEPQTTVVWRTHLPVSRDLTIRISDVGRFFEATPPHASEELETETWRVVEWISARAASLRPSDEPEALRPDDVVAIVLSDAGDPIHRWTAAELATTDKKALETRTRELSGATVVVDARLAGLRDGMLADAPEVPQTLDGGPWLDPVGGPPVVRFRVQFVGAAEAPSSGDWPERLRLALAGDGDEVSRWLVVDKWRHDAATEDDRSTARRAQELEEHQTWAEQRARVIAAAIGLPEPYPEVLALAARLHDEGKRALRWQRAANVRQDGRTYAKSDRPMNVALLDGYRHEFGSIPHAERDPTFRALPADLQDLVLHLIASHHGFARPLIETSGCEDAPPSALVERARAVALRFVRSSERWGPWGLAWWESLLRAADQQASRDLDDPDARGGGR